MRRTALALALLSPAIGAGLVIAAASAWSALGDIEFERNAGEAVASESAGVPPAYFPHWVHRIQYRCYVCHPKVFEMKAGANEITMEKMRQGESCALCHNGTLAFGIEFQTCARCHVVPRE